jgi:hypothetical protein
VSMQPTGDDDRPWQAAQSAAEKANTMGLPDRRRTVDAFPSEGRNRRVASSQTTNLADLLERVLDKGIVIAGDITLALGQVEILNIKVRLLIASIDKAQEIGIDWWRSDPALSSRALTGKLEQENRLLRERLDRLEQSLPRLPEAQPNLAAGGAAQPDSESRPNNPAGSLGEP